MSPRMMWHLGPLTPSWRWGIALSAALPGLVVGLVIARPPQAQPQPCPPDATLRAQRAQIEAALSQEQQRLERVQAEDARLTRDPVPFPDGLAPALAQERAPTVLADLARQIGVQIDAVDCSEFPCVAVATWSGPVTTAQPDWSGALEQAAGTPLTSSRGQRVRDGQRHMLWTTPLLVDADDLDAGGQLRLMRRVRDLGEAAARRRDEALR